MISLFCLHSLNSIPYPPSFLPSPFFLSSFLPSSFLQAELDRLRYHSQRLQVNSDLLCSVLRSTVQHRTSLCPFTAYCSAVLYSAVLYSIRYYNSLPPEMLYVLCVLILLMAPSYSCEIMSTNFRSCYPDLQHFMYNIIVFIIIIIFTNINLFTSAEWMS